MLCLLFTNLIDMRHEILDMSTLMALLKSNISHLKSVLIT
jgi:hypothetical protein